MCRGCRRASRAKYAMGVGVHAGGKVCNGCQGARRGKRAMSFGVHGAPGVANVAWGEQICTRLGGGGRKRARGAGGERGVGWCSRLGVCKVPEVPPPRSPMEAGAAHPHPGAVPAAPLGASPGVLSPGELLRNLRCKGACRASPPQPAPSKVLVLLRGVGDATSALLAWGWSRSHPPTPIPGVFSQPSCWNPNPGGKSRWDGAVCGGFSRVGALQRDWRNCRYAGGGWVLMRTSRSRLTSVLVVPSSTRQGRLRGVIGVVGSFVRGISSLWPASVLLWQLKKRENKVGKSCAPSILYCRC